MNKVSVCMATYNGERFIRQQIESIIPQLGANDELIISDDGSTDSTLQILSSYKDHRFKIIKNTRSGLPARTFESGLRHCSGDFIFLSDQDDIWMPSKIEETKGYLETYDLVLSNCSLINDQNSILTDSFFAQQKSRKGFAKNLIKNSYMGCCMAFNRKILGRILPFPERLQTHDQWIGLIAEKYHKVHFLSQPLVQYRRHGNNYSLTGEKSTSGFFEKIKHRMHMLLEVYKR